MNKSKLIASTAAALVLLGAATKVAELHRANRQLEFENSALRSKVVLIKPLEEENAHLRAGKLEFAAGETLLRERQESQGEEAELGRLRQRLAEMERQRNEDIQKVRLEIQEDQAKRARGEPVGEPNVFRTVPISGSLAVAAAQNRGSATPEALIETWLWAVEHQNTEVLRELRLTPGLPEEAQDHLRLRALLMLDETTLSDVVEVALKEKSVKGDDETRFVLELKRDREPARREWVAMDLDLKRFGREWKIATMGGHVRDDQ